MLSKEAFDRWAPSCDKDVLAYARADEYPFAGYFDALDQLFDLVESRPGSSVLDLGFGTAALTRRLYETGHEVSGIDFSKEMCDRAQASLPGFQIWNADLTQGLPKETLEKRYDFVVAAYSLHHLTEEQKTNLLKELRGCLRQDGAVLIADVCFPNRKALSECCEAYGDAWDKEECFFVSEELERNLSDYHVDVIPISFCADVLILSPED